MFVDGEVRNMFTGCDIKVNVTSVLSQDNEKHIWWECRCCHRFYLRELSLTMVLKIDRHGGWRAAGHPRISS